MRNKKLVLMVVLGLLALFVAGCGSNNAEVEDKSLATVQEKGEFVVGLDDNFPPMGFVDESGEIVGFDIDLANEVAKRMGVKAVFKPCEWDGIILSLKNKDIDVIWNGLTITEQRQKEIAFSEVYIKNRQIIVVGQDSDINAKADLAGKVVGLQMGSSSEDALNNDAETVATLKEVRQFANNTEALMDLAAGRVDAVVVDEIVGRYYIEKKPEVYRVLEDNFGQEAYGVGIRMEDESFRAELDKVLNEMKADGTAAEISKKWFGEDIITK